MFEAFARLWRNVLLILKSKASMAAQLEELERRMYAVEQDHKRLLALLRAQSHMKI